MNLRSDAIPAYVALAFPQAPDPAGMISRMRRRALKGTLTGYRAAYDAEGGLCAGLMVWSMSGAEWGMSEPRTLPKATPSALAELVADGLRVAVDGGARKVVVRLPFSDKPTVVQQVLIAAGFEPDHDRFEYEADVATLPTPPGTPLRWANLTEVTEENAAAMLEAVAQGAPDWDPLVDSGKDAVAAYRSDSVLTTGPDTIEIGYLGEEAVAFVCAQVNPTTGFSRIAYMGIVPELRGNGLGAWVHRRGFELLKKQGGTRYRGGTLGENEAMRRLFLRAGCREAAHLLELVWRGP